MKTLIRLLIKLVVFISLIYGLYFSLYRSNNEELIVLRELKNNKVIQVCTSKYNFIWQGVLPWKFKIDKIPVKYTSIINITFKIPSLSALSDESYLIKLPSNINYSIDKTNMPDISHMNSKTDLETYIFNKAAIICQSVLMQYIDPKYNKDDILRDEKVISESIKSEIMKKFVNIGIIVDKYEFISPGYYPENKLYAEGLIQNKEMRDLDFSNRKQEILLSEKLIKERYENELYFEKLLKISSLIKDNPEILKFIYIDKLGDDIKVIISSDKTGLPAMFSDNINNAKPGVKGDIDNLR